jgi:phosphopantothenoylcysteine synthetase/decarboxylase
MFKEDMALTVVYFPPDPTVIAPEGGVVRLAASTDVTNEEKVRKKRIMKNRKMKIKDDQSESDDRGIV